jgi:transposase
MLRLRDDQWERIREHFPEEHIRKPTRANPSNTRHLEVCLILNTGARLAAPMLSQLQTVHRRFQQWCEREVLREMLTQLAIRCARGTIDERESLSMRHLPGQRR